MCFDSGNHGDWNMTMLCGATEAKSLVLDAWRDEIKGGTPPVIPR